LESWVLVAMAADDVIARFGLTQCNITILCIDINNGKA